MNRFVALFLTCILLMSLLLAGCSKDNENPNRQSVTPTRSIYNNNNADGYATVTTKPKDDVISVFASTEEVPKMVIQYKKLHPDFPYKIKDMSMPTAEFSFTQVLDEYLAAGGTNTPDIYGVDSSTVMKYTQGDAAQYATPYKDLGIDVDSLINEADIAQYSIDIGKNLNGNIVGLSYQGTGGAFIYRRSIAKSVWGTDDPATIKDKIGPGWNKFFNAAYELKSRGYGIVSGDGDIWHSVENSADTPWVVNGKLNIDPKRKEFLVLAKKLKDMGFSNNTKDWTDAWYDDMKGVGKKKIFGFFGPAWLIQYVMNVHSGGDKKGKGMYGDWAVCEPPVGFFWGGTYVFANKNSSNKDALGDIIKWITLDSTDKGLQYYWANGKYSGSIGVKDTVASGTVMKNSVGKLDFIGGQNLFDVFYQAGKLANGNNITQYDDTINFYWREQVSEYVSGKKTKEKAIADFKKNIKNKVNIMVK